MKKFLIVGNDIHANRYKDVLLFRDDIEVRFNLLKNDVNEFDCIIFAEPYQFDYKWFKFFQNYKKILLLEKCQFELNLIKKLKCSIYFIHLRDYDNSKINVLHNNKIVWPNLKKGKMSKIYHTLPNIFDFIYNLYEGKAKMIIKECISINDKILLTILINDDSFEVEIQDVKVMGPLPTINGEDIQWPNYFKCINELIDAIMSGEMDFIKSYEREKIYKKLIGKVEYMTMELLKLEYSFNNNVIYKQGDKMLMAYNQENGDMYEFNEVGAEIFLLIAQEKKMKEIFEELTHKYSTTIDMIYDDVLELINRLIELKIIKKEN